MQAEVVELLPRQQQKACPRGVNMVAEMDKPLDYVTRVTDTLHFSVETISTLAFASLLL